MGAIIDKLKTVSICFIIEHYNDDARSMVSSNNVVKIIERRKKKCIFKRCRLFVYNCKFALE